MDRSHGLPCLLEGAQGSLSTWVQWPLHLAAQPLDTLLSLLSVNIV